MTDVLWGWVWVLSLTSAVRNASLLATLPTTTSSLYASALARVQTSGREIMCSTALQQVCNKILLNTFLISVVHWCSQRHPEVSRRWLDHGREAGFTENQIIAVCSENRGRDRFEWLRWRLCAGLMCLHRRMSTMRKRRVEHFIRTLLEPETSPYKPFRPQTWTRSAVLTSCGKAATSLRRKWFKVRQLWRVDAPASGHSNININTSFTFTDSFSLYLLFITVK